MNIQQIKEDFDQGKIVCRSTLVKLVDYAIELENKLNQRAETEQIACVIGATLAKLEGMSEDDLSRVKWSGGAVPEPEGDMWTLEYMPRGMSIAFALQDVFDIKESENDRA